MDKDNDSQKIDKESLGIFINPRTDFGFHRIFSHADMLKSFLNEVFAEEKESGNIERSSGRNTE
ncbi:MAG: hypothetical protein LBK97_08215 [Prevotellaceae bacterium]|jgi:hypothetical protein|nr:hypothetical protein [Prevotellaceae bacterium]